MNDAETAKEMTSADHVEAMLNSEGWKTVKGKLDAKILDLQNINNIDADKPDTLSIQILGRKLASDLLFAWLKSDVYGFVEQQRENNKSPKQEESFIQLHNG